MSMLVVLVPALFFIVGLGVMMRDETKSARRDESALDPMFLRRKG
jgi:hypothetical protein